MGNQYLTKIIIFFIFSLVFSNNLFANDKIHIIYKKPLTTVESNIEKELKNSATIESFMEAINDFIVFSSPTTIVFGAEDGPLYDSEKNQILIPYFFVSDIKNRLSKAQYSQAGISIKDAMNDILIHSIAHEIGHVLIYLYELPVLGKEEDAADGLATLLLIELFDEGQEIVISAADFFAIESEDKKEFDESDFWDEHSLDLQRYYSALCHVYGSNPEKYVSILEEAQFTEDRAELCIEEYNIMLESWFKLLKPYIKNKE